MAPQAHTVRHWDPLAAGRDERRNEHEELTNAVFAIMYLRSFNNNVWTGTVIFKSLHPLINLPFTNQS